MGVAERYKQKKDKNAVSRLGVAERYELRHLQDEANAFITANDNLFSTAAKDSQNTNYRADSQDWYNNYQQQVAKQREISKSLQDKLKKYSNYLDADTVKQLSDYMSSLDENYTKVANYAKESYDIWSSYKDEDEYKEAIKASELYENMKTDDLEIVKKDVDAYKETLTKVKEAEGILRIFNGREPSPNEMSPKQWEKYLESKALIKEYGSSKDVQAKLNEKSTYFAKAKNIQELDKYFEEATKAEDFGEMSQYVSTEADGFWDRLKAWGNDYADEAYEYINNVDDFRRRYNDNHSMYSADNMFDDGESKYEKLNYDHLKEEEIAVFNYYYSKFGKEKAYDFIDSLQETLNTRSANDIRKENDTNFERMLFAVSAGLDQFGQGIKNLFNFTDDYIAPSDTQIASGMIRKDLEDEGPKIFGSSLGQIGYDFITTTTNMAPSILTSMAVGVVNPALGAGVGATLMGASSAGNAYQDMLNAGYDKSQARVYSSMVGISEAGLQYALGGISKLGSGALSKFTAKTFEGLAKGINKASIQFAIKYGGQFLGNMASEALEESLQEVLDPFFKSIATGEKPEGVDWEQVAYSGMLGALSAGFLEGGGNIATRVSEISTARDIKREGNVETLQKVGKTFSADSIAYKIADKVTDKTGAYKLSMLLHDVKANLSEQNQQDIKNALVETGMAKENAESISKWLAKAVDGGNLTKGQQMALEDNPVISKVFKEVIIDKNSIVNQRLQGLMDLYSKEGSAGVDLTAIKENTPTKELLSANINDNNELKKAAEDAVRQKFGLNKITTRETDAYLDSMVNEVGTKADAIKIENATRKAIDSTSKAKERFENAVSGGKVSEENGVSVKKISAISKDGTVMAELEDGTVEEVGDITYKSEDEKYIILSTAGLSDELNVLGVNFDATSANAVINGFDSKSGTQLYVYMEGAKDTIKYGVIGQKRDTISKDSYYHKLTKSQQDYLYKIGRDIAEASAKKENSGNTSTSSNKAKKGKVTKSIRSKLKPSQKTAISTVEKLSEVGILKNNFYFFESKRVPATVNGQAVDRWVFAEDVGSYKKGTIAPNGIHMTASGDIYVDINAGEDGQGVALYTLAHELGHFVKAQNAEGFKVLADFVANELGGKFEELIQKKLDLWEELGRTEFNYMDAYEDVVCDALETMFTDGNLAQKLIEHSKSSIKGRGLLKTLKQFFEALYKRIQSAYAKLPPDDPAAKIMKRNQESVEKLADLFAKAIVGANENYATIGARTLADEIKGGMSAEAIAKVLKTPVDNIAQTNIVASAEETNSYSDRMFSQDYIDNLLNSFGITKPGDYLHVQKQVIDTLVNEDFFTDKEHRRRTEVNEESGMIIEINKSGIDETFNYHNYARVGRWKKFAKLATIRRLPEIIRYGKLVIDNAPNMHKGVETNKTFAYIEHSIDEEGKTITLRLDIKKSPQKNKFWVHKIIEIENVSNFPASTESGTEAGQTIADIGNILPRKTENVKKHSDRDTLGNKLTPKQIEFFKDSKVRDENGNLLVVYHGTPGDTFYEFSYDNVGMVGGGNHGYGFYFTDVEQEAKMYTQGKGNVIKSYINITNPIYATENDLSSNVGLIFDRLPIYAKNNLKEQHGDLDTAKKHYSKYDNGTMLSILVKKAGMHPSVFNNTLLNLGYDGIVYTEEGYANEYVVFESNQAKLTTNTNPTSNPDVRYSDRDYRLNSRNILANALESTAKNDVEREWLKKYKENIASLNADQQRLDEINAEIKAISFTKGSDRSKLTALNNNKKTLTARITRADKKLLEIEAAKPLKRVLEVEKKRVIDRITAQAREDIKAEKAASAKSIQELMKRYEERRKKNKDGKDKTVVRHKIKNVVTYLNTIFNRGTRERNVKLGLRDAVSKALATAEVLFSDEITNADIVRLGVESVTDTEMETLNKYADVLNRLDELNERLDNATGEKEIAELNAEISRAKAQISKLNSLLKDVFARERARLNRQVVSDTLKSLAEAYADLTKSDDNYIKDNAFVQGMYDRIINLSEELDGVTIKDMSLKQLKAVYEMYKMVKHMVTDANSIFRNGKREDLATKISNVQAEIDAIVSSSKDKLEAVEKVADFLKGFTWNELKPYAAFQRLGSKTFEELFWDVVEADNVWARDTEEAANVIEEAREKHGYKKWDMKTAKTFKSSNGLDFKLTLGDMMSIYAYSKRPQAADHMTIGGFQFDTGKTYKKEKTEKGVKLTYRHAKLSETYNVDPVLIGNIIEEIKKIDGVKEYVDEIQSYLTKLGEKGNEVSRTMFGIDLFNEKVYFPLQSASDYRSSIEQTLNATQTMASLKNIGVSKETVPHANNPIVLKSFDDVVLEHINTMAKYHAYVIPIENLSKVFNNVGKDAVNGVYTSTQALISSKFGDAATKYFKQFITDLNGGSLGGGAKNPLSKFFGTAKAVSVAANMSVVVQQYFAVIRAMDEINPKYMIPFLYGEASKSNQKQWEELKKYAPVAIIKEIGGFDMGANRSAIDYMGEAQTKLDAKKVGKKVKDASMRLAGKMDEIGWSTIWRAVKKEIAETTDLRIGTDEFFQACGKRFTEVVAKTQVYDSVTSRSGYMRSKHETVKYLTSFMGEPTAIVNMMYLKQLAFVRAIKAKDAKAIKKASLNLIRGSAVIILSTVLTSLAKSLPYAMRDDEEEEEALLERWAKHFGEAIASDMNPLNMLPIGRDLVSIWEGWDVERPDLTLISDLFTSFKKAIDDDCTIEEALTLAGSFANILGYPLKNVIRDAKSIIRLFGDITDDVLPTDIGGELAEGFTGETATDALWKAITNNDTEKLNRLKTEYKTESKYQSAVRKALRENDPRIKKAARAKYDGDMDTFKQIVLEIKAEGYFSQDDIVSAVNSAVTTLKNKYEEEPSTDWYNEESKEEKEEISSVYKGSDVNDALERGDIEQAREIIKDIVAAKVKNGKTKAEAYSSIKSSLSSYWKDIYLSASDSEKINIRKMLHSTKVYSSASEIVKLTRKWEKDSK